MTIQADIRAAIKAKMQGVTDIGVVHDYERYSDKMSDFRALYQTTIGAVTQIRGWYIRYLSRREESDYHGRYFVTFNWRIQGYMSLDDSAATEKTFAELIEALITAFRDDETLGGVVASTILDNVAGLQIEDAGPVMFGGVLCHSARARLMTQHYI